MILIYAFVGILFFVIIFTIILSLLPAGPNFLPNEGKDSIGTWRLVNTYLGVKKSYYFNGPLMNSNDQYLDFNNTSKTLIFGKAITWHFDGLKLYTADSTGTYYYVAAAEGGTIYLSKTVASDWLFDGFNFYLNYSLTSENVSYFNPLTLKLSTINKLDFTFYEPTTPRWIAM